MSPIATRRKPRARAKVKSQVALVRKLGLTNPHLSGADVKAAQRLLKNNPYGNFQPGAIDGEFGPGTAGATKAAKWALGFPAKACTTSFGPGIEGFLRGKALPPQYQARRRQFFRYRPGRRTSLSPGSDV